MNDETIRAEVEKIVKQRDKLAPDYVLIGDVVALCKRVREEQREEDAKKCDQRAGRYSKWYIEENVKRNEAEACAAAIRNGEQPNE